MWSPQRPLAPGGVERAKRDDDQNPSGTKLETRGISLTSIGLQMQTAWGPAGPFPGEFLHSLAFNQKGFRSTELPAADTANA